MTRTRRQWLTGLAGLTLVSSAIPPDRAAAVTCGRINPRTLARRSDLIVVGRVIEDSIVETRTEDREGFHILLTEAKLQVDGLEKGWLAGGRRQPVTVIMQTMRPEDDDLGLGICGPTLFVGWSSVRYYLKEPTANSKPYRLLRSTALKE